MSCLMSRILQALGLLVVSAVCVSPASGQWWRRPWDHKVAPNPKQGQSWYLESVNDMGGTPEEDNQRDISKSLGRIRKFRLQTLHRLWQLRDLSEVVAMGNGFAGQTATKAAPLFDKAESVIQEAVAAQDDGRIAGARQKIDRALELLAEGERTMETAIAILADRRHVQHLRNAIVHCGADELNAEVDEAAAALESAAAARVRNLAEACAAQRKLILELRRKLGRLEKARDYRDEFDRTLDLCEYLLLCVAKDGPKEETFDGEKVLRDSEVSDLTLGSVSTVARRVAQLRFRLRQLSNRMSAAKREPMTDSISDRLSAKLGFPIDDLDHFTRSKFGWVNSTRLSNNNPWHWEFNYTPPDADAISIAGRWLFQVDPKFEGEENGWHKPEADTSGWRNLYAPNAWERQGVNDWNSIENFLAAQQKVTGRELPERRGRGYERVPEHRHYNGVAWYRKEVFIPRRWEGSNLALHGERIGGKLRIFVNGLAVGPWGDGRRHTIPAAAIHFGEPNVFCVACFNSSGNGGFTRGPLWLQREGGEASFRFTPYGSGFVNEESYTSASGELRFNIVMSMMSPASLIASEAKDFHLWGWSMKGYAVPTEAVLAGPRGVRAVKLDGTKEITAGAAMKENWLLLNVGKGYGHPVLIVFQHKPEKITWRADPLREGLVATFPKVVGQVGLIHPGPGGTAVDSLVKAARTWSRAMLAYPEHASEFWKVDPARKNMAFEIIGEFSLVYNYHTIRDDWGTKPLAMAGLPLLTCYALDYKYPGFAEGDWEKTGVPVDYQAYAQCEFRAKTGTNRITYASPCADHSRLWRGVGTLFQEVWGPAAATTKRWGSNNNRAGFAFHQDWHTHLVEGLGLKVRPQEYEEWKELDRTVDLHRENRLFMFILDFSNAQNGDPRSLYYPYTGGYLRQRPEAREGLAEFWKDVATRYRQVPADLLGYNFNNEPCTIDVETYNKLIRRLTEAVRSVDKEKWITIDFGDGWANCDFVFATKPIDDPKIAYNWHLYYKHDGIIEGRSPELLFPRWNDADPYHWNNGPEWFLDRIVDAFVYQTVHHVPLWCGEFGGSINNPNQEMLIWCEWYCGMLERFGHGWSWWNYNGRDYGRTGLAGRGLISPTVLVLKRFMARKGAQ